MSLKSQQAPPDTLDLGANLLWPISPTALSTEPLSSSSSSFFLFPLFLFALYFLFWGGLTILASAIVGGKAWLSDGHGGTDPRRGAYPGQWVRYAVGWMSVQGVRTKDEVYRATSSNYRAPLMPVGVRWSVP